MPGSLPTNWLDALNWNTSTGGAAGAAETTSTIGTDRVDARVPPDQYTIGGLQISRMRQLLVAMSAFYKGGTRLQVLAQSSNPFGAGEAGFWTDNANNAKFTAANGTVTTLGAGGGGGGTLATVYSGGASQADSTMSLDSTRGKILIKDNATPIGALFEIQTSGGISLWKFDASNFTLGANMGITITAGTSAIDFSNGTGLFKTTTGTHTIGGTTSWAQGKTVTIGAAETFGTTPTTFLTLQNTTAATSGNQKFSPSLQFIGQGWGTGGAASQQVAVELFMRPVQASNATPDLVIRTLTGGGALTEVAKISAQTYIGTSDIFLQGVVANTGAGVKSAGGNGIIVTDDTNGTCMQYTSATSITLLSAAWQAVSGVANGANNKAFQFTTTNGLSSSGASGLAVSTNGKYHRFAVTSGAVDVYCIAHERVADTSGTTVNRLVAATANNKVAIPAATANLHTIAGVALATQTSGNTVSVAHSGDVFVEYDGSAPALGDVLVSSGTTAGRVIVNNAAAAGTVVGMALEAGGTTTAGQVRMQLKLS